MPQTISEFLGNEIGYIPKLTGMMSMEWVPVSEFTVFMGWWPWHRIPHWKIGAYWSLGQDRSLRLDLGPWLELWWCDDFWWSFAVTLHLELEDRTLLGQKPVYLASFATDGSTFVTASVLLSEWGWVFTHPSSRRWSLWQSDAVISHSYGKWPSKEWVFPWKIWWFSMAMLVITRE